MTSRSHCLILVALTCALTGALTACGAGAAPVISDLHVSTSPVIRGQQATGQLTVADADGLSDLKLELTFSGPADVTAETQVQGGTDAITEAPVPFFFMLTAASPAGSYTLAVVAVDGEGNESNAQKVGLEVQ